MKITLTFFGILRSLTACREMQLDVPEKATIKDAIDCFIQASDPAVGQYLKPAYGGYAVRFSVGGNMIRNDNHILAPNDIIKLLVPLSGG